MICFSFSIWVPSIVNVDLIIIKSYRKVDDPLKYLHVCCKLRVYNGEICQYFYTMLQTHRVKHGDLTPWIECYNMPILTHYASFTVT